MKHAITLALLVSLASPAAAQDSDEDSNLREGWGLLSEGSRLILEGLAEEMRPFVDEHLLPMIAELGALIDDVAMYELPERLPNGDIIIRRRVPLDPETGEELDPVDDPVDL
ncbi:AAA+ family ATPase [Nioella sp. MMSF_3534]|jgi:hypothetical protein|uniref:AAA+ family ATPase n=1 Tax=Nioella sp. MMSF_3534 TaxID=3046720 RepID=UPI00273F24B9|nr:AAA+ family ATPase [Nioella sp. MMSF_3534]